MHALNANEISEGVWIFNPENNRSNGVEENVKLDFLQKMNENRSVFRNLFEECLYNFIREDSSMQSAYDDFIADANNCFIDRQVNLCRCIISSPLFESTISPLLVLKNREKLAELKSRSVSDYAFCFEKFAPHCDQICWVIKDKECFQDSLQEMLVAKEELEQSKARFFNEIFPFYEQAVIDREYHLSDRELKLAAYLYGEKVVLISANQTKVFNENAVDEAIIQYEGLDGKGHYIRL